MPGIDNYAHLGGFAGGYFTSAFLNPMTRERGDHMIIAMVCLAATAPLHRRVGPHRPVPLQVR